MVARARGDEEVLAVMLFGSAARGEAKERSDVDICLVLPPGRYAKRDLTEKRLEYLSEFDADIQVFQGLPIYIRSRVLKEGRVLFCRDEPALYEVALRTIKEFEDFKPLYRMYLEEVVKGGA